MKRTVSVTATCSFEFEIDDEATSDWDGATILNMMEKRRDYDPPVFTPEAKQSDILGHLGIHLCVENRTMGMMDGWADFGAEAAVGSPYSVDWTIDSVDVGEPES